ncbi:MAG: hypothetical protein ABIO67_04120 [Mycobacteriales bacterium]
MKQCVTCHEAKPFDAFNQRLASADGRQPRCRDCAARYYQDNRAKHIARVRVRNIAVREANRRRLAELLASASCLDCGEDDLRVLDFDHRPDSSKRDDVATLAAMGLSWAVIEAEIEKCDVRCANCHRRRTCERAGWWKQAVWEQRPTSEKRLLDVLRG